MLRYLRVVLVATLISVIITAIYSVALNRGYDVGLQRCRADKLLEGLTLDKIECKYKK